MAYTPVSFVPGEILTAAKMNLLAANDASLRDGTGIAAGAIAASHLPTAQVGGGSLGAGTTTKTFVPNTSGILMVVTGGRRNAASAADLVVNINTTGTTNKYSHPGVQNGTGVFVSASHQAVVQKGVSVTITITASGGSYVNSGWMFAVIPATIEVVA